MDRWGYLVLVIAWALLLGLGYGYLMGRIDRMERPKASERR